MGFGQAVVSGFNGYIQFSGRSPRSAYWYFILFTVLCNVALAIMHVTAFDAEILSTIFVLITFLPATSVNVRRLHDIGRSGWWWWLWLVPIIGMIVMIIWVCTKGQNGENRFGADPLHTDASWGAEEPVQRP